jgi:NTP pyrophosphatase (non-canonical NTP hydrolase)
MDQYQDSFLMRTAKRWEIRPVADDLQETHAALVKRLFVRRHEGSEALMHGASGVVKEAGELLDAAYRVWNYGRALDRANAVEELGDIEFYLQAFRQSAGITREETLEQNIVKLGKRYPQGYTDAHAAMRLDKA